MKLFWALLAAIVIGWPTGLQAQLNPPITCNATAIYGASTNGSTRLVVGQQGKAVYLCGFVIYGGGTASVKLITGTGTVCATGAADLTPAFAIIAQSQVNDTSPFFRGLYVDPLTDVCINTSAGVAIQAIVYYAQR